MDDTLLTTIEAAAYTKVTVDWLRRLSSRGDGPRIAEKRGPGPGPKHGNRYRRSDLDAWMAAGRGYMRNAAAATCVAEEQPR